MACGVTDAARAAGAARGLAYDDGRSQPVGAGLAGPQDGPAARCADKEGTAARRSRPAPRAGTVVGDAADCNGSSCSNRGSRSPSRKPLSFVTRNLESLRLATVQRSCGSPGAKDPGLGVSSAVVSNLPGALSPLVTARVDIFTLPAKHRIHHFARVIPPAWVVGPSASIGVVFHAHPCAIWDSHTPGNHRWFAEAS